MKKTLKDCPVHGHGANGLGCYCKRKAPKWIMDIISEEKAKWKDDKGKFGVGVRAGIESIEFRLTYANCSGRNDGTRSTENKV